MITFYYEIPKLIDRAQVKSLLFVKEIENKDTGLPALEENAISDDDEQLIRKTFLKDVANEIYGMLSPYSRTLADLDTPLKGFEFEATYTPDEGDPVLDCIIFRVIMPTYFDDEMVSPLENAIKNTIINYVVMEFLYHNNLDGSTFMKLYEKNKGEILKYINRRTKLKRSYKWY